MARPLCSKLVAAVSGSICIAVVSVSGGGIVLSEQTVVVAEGVGLAERVQIPGTNTHKHTTRTTPHNTRQEQTPQTTTRRTTPHLTTIEGGAAAVRTSSHTRVGVCTRNQMIGTQGES